MKAAFERIFMCFSIAQFAIVIAIWLKLIARTLKGSKFNREKCLPNDIQIYVVLHPHVRCMRSNLFHAYHLGRLHG